MKHDSTFAASPFQSGPAGANEEEGMTLLLQTPSYFGTKKKPTRFLPPAKVTYSLKTVAFTSVLGLQGTTAVLMNRRQSPEVYSFAIFGVLGVSAENS